MIELLFGSHAPYVWKVIHFVVGNPNRGMGFAYLLLIVNAIRAMLMQRTFRTPFLEGFEKAFAYLVCIILGNIVDSLMVNELFGWQGSTQYLICLYLVARELKVIRDYLVQRYGIDIPILNQRLDQMEQGQTNATSNWQDPNATHDLNQRINHLRQELQQLEEQQQTTPPSEEPPVG